MLIARSLCYVYGRITSIWYCKIGRKRRCPVPSLAKACGIYNVQWHRYCSLEDSKKIDDLPYLQVRISDVQLYGEVEMCGYPRGCKSQNFSTAHIGKRLSPVIQLERVASLFPVDNSFVPNGFQTDMVDTAGSSGSVIVDLNGSGVGLVLEVLGADVMVGDKLYTCQDWTCLWFNY